MGEGTARALILDRDGTVNEDFGYVCEPERFVFKEGIFDLCRAAQSAGFKIIVISNQSGVSRGYYSEAEMEACNARMCAAFRDAGVEVSDVICCTSQDDADPRRKPNPGMFREAIARHGLEPSRCVARGDSERDAVAARRAGVGLVLRLGERDGAETAADATVHALRDAIAFFSADAAASATGKETSRRL